MIDYTLLKEAIGISNKAALLSWLSTVIVILAVCLIWKPMKRHDRIYNVHAIGCILSALAVSYVVLRFDLSYWWLLVCLFILAYPLWRWLWFKWQYNKLKKVKGRELDIAQVGLFRKLSKSCVFEWEIRRYVLPLLQSLYSIGAFKSLEGELKRYSRYSDNKMYAQETALLMANQGNYLEMQQQLKTVLANTDIHDKHYQYLINNIYVAARNRNDFATMDVIFPKMENYLVSVEEKDSVIIEILTALFYRYDQMGNEAGKAKVRGILSSRKPKTFTEYLDIKDIEFFYDRRHGNRQGIIQSLDEVMEKADEMVEDEESRLIFKLKILPRFVEFDYNWKKMTQDVFQSADYYFGKSDEVALVYVEMLTTVVSDALTLHGLTIQPDHFGDLMRKVYYQASSRLNAIKSSIFNMEDIFLYRKIAMYRRLYLLERIGTAVKPNCDNYVAQLVDSHKKILELCAVNGQELEYIHFLMTYIDEFLTARGEILGMPVDEDVTNAINRIQAEEPDIRGRLNELKEKLKKYDHNASVAYPTLWAANFCHYYGEDGEARVLLQKFQSHKIDIRNFTLAVQRMYASLCNVLSVTP